MPPPAERTPSSPGRFSERSLRWRRATAARGDLLNPGVRHNPYRQLQPVTLGEGGPESHSARRVVQAQNIHLSQQQVDRRQPVANGPIPQLPQLVPAPAPQRTILSDGQRVAPTPDHNNPVTVGADTTWHGTNICSSVPQLAVVVPDPHDQSEPSFLRTRVWA